MGPGQSAPALLLRAAACGEKDRVATLLTAERGRFSAFARASRGSQRRFGGSLQPFCLFEAAWKDRSGAMPELSSAQALEFPLGPTPSLEALASAWTFLELGQELCPRDEPQPAFFELLLGGLRRLGKGAEDPGAVRLSVAWGALAQAGFAPALNACASCGEPGPFEAGALEADAHGALCGPCARRRNAPLLKPADWKALLDAAAGRPGTASEGAEDALARFTSWQLGKPLRTAGLSARLRGGTP